MTTDAHDERDRLARSFAREIPEIVRLYDESVAAAQARYERQLAYLFVSLAESAAPEPDPAQAADTTGDDLGSTLRAIAAEGEVERIRDGVTSLLAEVADTTDDGAQFLDRLRVLVFPPGRDQPHIVVDADSNEPPPYDPPEAHVLSDEAIANDVDRTITGGQS